MRETEDPFNDPAQHEAMIQEEEDALAWEKGEEPAWYYPLVGKVAIAAGNLEHEAVAAALCLHQGMTWGSRDLSFWLSSTTRMDTLFQLLKGTHPQFDALVSELPDARRRRNAIVHVAVGWHEFASEQDPGGWHYMNARDGSTVYLTEQVRQQMEADEIVLIGLAQRFFALTVTLMKAYHHMHTPPA